MNDDDMVLCSACGHQFVDDENEPEGYLCVICNDWVCNGCMLDTGWCCRCEGKTKEVGDDSHSRQASADHPDACPVCGLALAEDVRAAKNIGRLGEEDEDRIAQGQGWAEFRRQLAHKLAVHGQNLTTID